MDQWWLPSVTYADDILLTAATKRGLEDMLKDLTEAMAEVGLEIGHEKTNWSSTRPYKEDTLQAGPEKVPWKASFVFVGIEISLQGTSAPAIAHRMGAAAATRRRWKCILNSPWIHKKAKMEILRKAVWPSLLWGAGSWNPTKLWQQKLESWGARTLASTCGTRKGPDDTSTTWWRRMHRTGHELMQQNDLSVESHRRDALHRWAGHVARLPADHRMAQAMRTRSLPWWRHAQEQHRRSGDKWGGVHAARFTAWRWESQLEGTYGKAKVKVIQGNAGWWALAQDRHTWRELGTSFKLRQG